MYWLFNVPKQAVNFISNAVSGNGLTKGENTNAVEQTSSKYNRLNLSQQSQNITNDKDNIGIGGDQILGTLSEEQSLKRRFERTHSTGTGNNPYNLSTTSDYNLSSSRDRTVNLYGSEVGIRTSQSWEKRTDPHNYKFSQSFSQSDDNEDSINGSTDNILGSSAKAPLISSYDIESGSCDEQILDCCSSFDQLDLLYSEIDDEDLTCNVCDRTYETLDDLLNHQMKKRHYGCSICEDLFPSWMALEAHKEIADHFTDNEDDFEDIFFDQDYIEDDENGIEDYTDSELDALEEEDDRERLL